MNIKEISKEIYDNNKAKGFWDNPRNTGELLMLVVSELGEALEADRKSHYAPYPINSDMLHMKISGGTGNIATEVGKTIFEANYKDTFEDEIADAIIRLLDISIGKGIDIEWHIREKMNYNATRPHKHGKAY